jgi:hypothetical protein
VDAADVELFERSIRQATEHHAGAALDDVLVELGWLDALADDPWTAVSVLFPLQGGANATSRALEQVVVAGLGLPPAPGDAVVLPALGTSAPPGTVDEDGLSVRGLGTSAVAHAERAVVVATRVGDSPVVTEVRRSELRLRTVAGIDPGEGMVDVTADAVTTGVDTGPASWEAAVMLGRLALSFEIVGAARSMLTLARDHALDRVQYGQPIARFQAVRHRLAEALVAIEAADAVLTAARDAPSPELAAAAKALAGRGAMATARHCQQVLAGIGFTAEHPFHRHYRRMLLLDQMFGSAHSLTAEHGEQLLRSRQLPTLLPL